MLLTYHVIGVNPRAPPPRVIIFVFLFGTAFLPLQSAFCLCFVRAQGVIPRTRDSAAVGSDEAFWRYEPSVPVFRTDLVDRIEFL